MSSGASAWVVDAALATDGEVRSDVREVRSAVRVTTGFGSLANVRIEPEQAATLQGRIVRSHATAVGPPLSREEARAMLLLRAHVLALSAATSGEHLICNLGSGSGFSVRDVLATIEDVTGRPVPDELLHLASKGSSASC